METQKIEGQLEIDHERRVIYFHSAKDGSTRLRICRIQKQDLSEVDLIDLCMEHTTFILPENYVSDNPTQR